MSHDEDEDLYDEEFDFVDDDADEDVEDSDEDVEVSNESAADERDEGAAGDETAQDESVDEYGRPEPKPDYVVHVYEHKKFKRTIERPFIAEDAEAFATEFNRTSKSYGRL